MKIGHGRRKRASPSTNRNAKRRNPHNRKFSTKTKKNKAMTTSNKLQNISCFNLEASSSIDESIQQFEAEKKAMFKDREAETKKTTHRQHTAVNSEGETLSLSMKSAPTAEQLKHREGDAVSAQMSYAVDSGLGRMKQIKRLHKELIKLRKGESDGKHIPPELEELVEEIKNENSDSNLSRIIRSFKQKIDKHARLLCCAACGIKNFQMGKHHFHQTKLSDLEVLVLTQEEVDDLNTTDPEYRYTIQSYLPYN